MKGYFRAEYYIILQAHGKKLRHYPFYHTYSARQAELERSVNSQEIKLKQLTNDGNCTGRLLSTHYMTISKYKELEDMGFGLPMLTKLCDMIHEVAHGIEILPNLAVKKFFNDIAENYSPILGYESKIAALRSEFETKKSELILLSTVLDSKKEMAEVLSLLLLTRTSDKKSMIRLLSLYQTITRKK